MSRSRRKTPITGITTAKSEKKFKKLCHKALRAKERALLHRIKAVEEEDLVFPYRPRDVVETYAGDKDGKTYHGRLKRKDLKLYHKLMRK